MPVDAGADDGTALGADPVANSDAPTEDRPPLGKVFVVNELDDPDDDEDEPMEPIPLMVLEYHSGGRSSLGRKRL